MKIAKQELRTFLRIIWTTWYFLIFHLDYMISEKDIHHLIPVEKVFIRDDLWPFDTIKILFEGRITQIYAVSQRWFVQYYLWWTKQRNKELLKCLQKQANDFPFLVTQMYRPW